MAELPIGTPEVGYLRVPIGRTGFRDIQDSFALLPSGEWNTFEITCKGKDITVWVNGAVTTQWHDCQVPRGYVGLEAEGYRIEFRNVKLKPLDGATGAK